MKRLISDASLTIIVSELAKRINKITSENVIFVGVLNGCFMFFSDLMKKITIEHEVAFIKAKSYTKNSQGDLEVDYLENDFKDKTVILIEDIIDTGKTLEKIEEDLINKHHIRDLFVVTLLVKKKSLHLVDFYGQIITENSFVFGYGMDNNGKERNLVDIYEL